MERIGDKELEAIKLTQEDRDEASSMATIGLIDPGDTEERTEEIRRMNYLCDLFLKRHVADAQLSAGRAELAESTKAWQFKVSQQDAELLRRGTLIADLYAQAEGNDTQHKAELNTLIDANQRRQERIVGLERQLVEAKARIAGLQDEANALHRERKGEVWYWQGDGEDHLESLTCPVLIEAEDLRQLLQARLA